MLTIRIRHFIFSVRYEGLGLFAARRIIYSTVDESGNTKIHQISSSHHSTSENTAVKGKYYQIYMKCNIK